MNQRTSYLTQAWPGWSPVCLAACLAVAATVCGCGEGRPTRVPVEGRVLIDGEPLTHGHVRFVPEGARPSAGQLDSEGRFTLTCYDGQDGAVLGTHRVEVSASELTAGGMRWHAPKKYNRYNTSGLEVEIAGPTDDLEINLTWDGGQPFTERAEAEW